MSERGLLARAVWRHRLFIVVLTAALGGVAWYFATQPGGEPTASVLVRVEPSASAGAARAYAEIAETQTLVALIHNALGDEATDGGDIRLNARAQEAGLVRIEIQSESAERAAAAAAALPSLLAQLAAAQAFGERVVALEPPERSESRSTESVALIVFLAVLVGLVANSILAVLMERFSDRLPSPLELEKSVGKPVLATVRSPTQATEPMATLGSSPPTVGDEDSQHGLSSGESDADLAGKADGAPRERVSAGAGDP